MMKPIQIFRSYNSVGQLRGFLSSKFSLTRRNDPQSLWICCSSCHQSARKYSMENKQKETFLIAGLGNHDLPGSRHSVGMQLVNKLARFLSVEFKKSRDCLGFVGDKELSDIHVVLLKPRQAMNINGASVHKTAKKYSIPVTNIYLVHDDLDKKVGKVGLKEKGSAGGHNGVKSVIQSFKTDEIVRLRIGIDRPASIDMVRDYVLQNFKPNEKSALDHSIDHGILRIAQHIGARTGVSAAQVFRAQENKAETDVCEESIDRTHDGSEVT